jgi:4-nitrophenyl phosphatase
MKTYKGYLIDLDGTIYRGIEAITEAVDFVNELNNLHLPYLFVTNNSSRTPSQVAEKLRGFGVKAEEENVFTSSLATANYLYDQKKNASVYIIGEEGIQTAIQEKGLSIKEDQVDFVVIGMDRSISYEKFAIACLAVRNGAILVSTNADIALPTERGLLPGNGSLTAVIAVSTRTEPIFIGKPEAIIMDQALKVLGTSKEETLMIGDNFDTDIMAGINAGLDTLLVHTGITTKENLLGFKKQPTYVVDGLDQWEIK